MIQFVFFKLLSYCFEETIGFDVKTSFASRPRSRLIKKILLDRRYDEPLSIYSRFVGMTI